MRPTLNLLSTVAIASVVSSSAGNAQTSVRPVGAEVQFLLNRHTVPPIGEVFKLYFTNLDRSIVQQTFWVLGTVEGPQVAWYPVVTGERIYFAMDFAGTWVFDARPLTPQPDGYLLRMDDGSQKRSVEFYLRGVDDLQLSTTTTPEPPTAFMLGSGLLALVVRGLRERAQRPKPAETWT